MLDEKAKEYFRKMGSKGGKITLKKYGTSHMSKAGKKGALMANKVIHSKGVDGKAE